MRATNGNGYPDGAAELARLILDAIEAAVGQDRWEVADRLLFALEELERGTGDPASLDFAHESVATMMAAISNDRRRH